MFSTCHAVLTFIMVSCLLELTWQDNMMMVIRLLFRALNAVWWNLSWMSFEGSPGVSCRGERIPAGNSQVPTCLLTTWRLHLYPTVSCPARHSSEIYTRPVTCSKVKVAERNDLILFCKHLRDLKPNLSASLGHCFQSSPPMCRKQVRWKEHC